MQCELSEPASAELLAAAAEFGVDHEELLSIYVLTGTRGSVHPAVLAFWLRVSQGQSGSVSGGIQ